MAKLPLFLGALGHSYLQRFEHDHCTPDIETSISLYRQAAAANGIPSHRLCFAKKTAKLSAVHDTTHCLTDFAVAIDLLSEVAGLDDKTGEYGADLLGSLGAVGRPSGRG